MVNPEIYRKSLSKLQPPWFELPPEYLGGAGGGMDCGAVE